MTQPEHWLSMIYPDGQGGYQGQSRHTSRPLEEMPLITVPSGSHIMDVRTAILDAQREHELPRGDIMLTLKQPPTMADWHYLRSLWPTAPVKEESEPEGTSHIDRDQQAAIHQALGKKELAQRVKAPMPRRKTARSTTTTTVEIAGPLPKDKEAKIRVLLERKATAGPDEARRIRKQLRDLGYKLSEHRG